MLKVTTAHPLLGGGRVDDVDGVLETVVDGEGDVVTGGSEDVVVELGVVDEVDVEVLPVVDDASVE